MFSMSYTTPKEPVGKIYHKPNKYPKCLGRYTDGLGNVWDIRGIGYFEEEDGSYVRYVQACRNSSLHPYYNDTSGYGSYGWVHQVWEPYVLEEIADS